LKKRRHELAGSCSFCETFSAFCIATDIFLRNRR
jgi:hypothetical protein